VPNVRERLAPGEVPKPFKMPDPLEGIDEEDRSHF
jgi:hypothetical protein